MHGDEGDDQHGLKVHEVHDMQPGLPSHAQHQVNLDSGKSAVGDALQISAQQHGASAQVSMSHPLLPDTTASAVVTDAPIAAQKAPVMSDAEDSGQEALVSSKEELSTELVIDLCSPVKPKQKSAQPQQLPQLQRGPQLQHPPQPQQPSQLQQPPQLQQSQLQQSQLHAETALQPAEAGLLPQPLPKSPDLSASDDEFPELRCRSGSQSQAGKPTMATLHDLRPAGIQDDLCAQLTSVTQPTLPELQGHLPEPQGRESGLQGSEPEAQGSEPEPQGIESEPQGHEPEPQSHEPDAQGSESEPQGHKPEAQGSELEPQGVYARVRGLLQRQGCGLDGVDSGDGDAALPLTQAEVIEAQTADEEKPLVGFPPSCCFAVPLPWHCVILHLVRVLFFSSACVTDNMCPYVTPQHQPYFCPLQSS